MNAVTEWIDTYPRYAATIAFAIPPLMIFAVYTAMQLLRPRPATAVAFAALLASLLPMLVFDPTPAKAASAVQDQPNIVVIETDDMRLDDLAAMPNTKRLLGGTNGTRYTNATVSTPLCCPSRATFLTGQHSHNHGVHTNGGDHGAVDELDEANTLPVWLQGIGYDTVMLGKYLNGYGEPDDGVKRSYVPPAWDFWRATPKPSTSNYTDFDVTMGSSTTDAPATGTIRHVTNGYQTWYFTARAVEQIETRIPTDRPMFMWLSYFAPHNGQGDFQHQSVPAEPKYRGDSKVGLPTSPAFDEFKVDDKPRWIRSLPRLSGKVENRIRTERRERRDALRSVDDGVGRVVAALRESGELGNTVIMFTSDNGWMLGEHRINRGKVVPYREAARVPLLIRGPGFTPGVNGAPVSNIDLAPTIVDLAGADPGLVMDGMSLLAPVPGNRPILIEYLGDQPPADIGMPPYAGVTRDGWQYIEYRGGARELYDLATDPWQQNNVAGRRPERQSALAADLDRLRDCQGGACR